MKTPWKAEPAVAVTPLLSEMEFEADSDSLKDECAHILKLCVSRAAHEDSAQMLRQASFGSTALSALCKAGLLLQVADKEFQLTESAVRSSEKQSCCLGTFAFAMRNCVCVCARVCRPRPAVSGFILSSRSRTMFTLPGRTLRQGE